MVSQQLSQSQTLQLTKLLVPNAIQSLIHRERLLDQLNSPEQHALIIAPAGYGKTTLVTQWLQTNYAQEQIAWVSIDASDNNARVFLNYLIVALGQHQMPELDTYLRQDRDVILNCIVNNLLLKSELPKVLILDDYHLIDDDNSDVHTIVRYLLNTAIPQLKLVILSRKALPFSVAKLRAEQGLKEICFDDLRFTRNEVQAYFESRLNLSLSEKQLTILSQSTEGWVVGMAMIALRLLNTRDIDALLEQCAGTEQFVSDYLLSEIFEQQSKDVQDFLVQSSLLNQLNGDLCDAVLQGQDSGEKLAYLDHMGMLIIPLDWQKQWYRYHHFLLDFLRERLSQVDDSWCREAHQRASYWFTDNANNKLEAISSALYHAEKVDEHFLLSTVQGFGEWLLKQGHQQLIISYLAPFSINKLGDYPTLLIYYLWALLGNGDREHLHLIIDRASRFIPDGLQGDLLAIRAEIEPDWQQRQILCEQASSLLSEGDRITRCLLEINLAQTAFFVDGQTAYAIESLSRIVAQCDQLQATQLWMMTLDCLIAIRYRHGSLIEAEALCRHAIESCEQNEQSSLSCAFYSQLGKILYERNHLTEAETVLRHCRQICEHPINTNSYVASSMMLMRCLADDEAVSILEETRQIVGTSSYQLRRLDGAKDFHLATHGWIAPRIDWQKSGFDSQTEQVTIPSLYTYLVLARRLVYGDKSGLRSALSLLGQLQNLCQKIDRRSDLIECLMLTAIAYERLNQRDSAITALKEALLIARQTGHIRLFIDAGRWVEMLLEQIAQQQYGHSNVLLLFDSSLSTSPTIELQEPLTRRETELLGLLSEGLTNTEISQSLSISLNTTRWHLKNIFRKLEVDNRTKASAYARNLGIAT